MVLKDAVSDKLFIELAEADYLISLAALKAHARAGITLTAKNHFGSHARPDAVHLHPSLVAPDEVSVSFNVSFSNVAISLNALKENLSIYPNPVANGTLNVGFTHPSQGIVSMKILNSNGQIIKRFAEFKSSGAFKAQLALQEIDRGFYILEIHFDNTIAAIRFAR
ncbi:MAG: DUF362 domain-containing protein [Bacteroidales bacterium]|nr:DUF362 domain-containing protein [Bacteroidales bacterium]